MGSRSRSFAPRKAAMVAAAAKAPPTPPPETDAARETGTPQLPDPLRAVLARAQRVKLADLQRTFFCVGPVCLRSGVGLGVGVGCGAGVLGGGWLPFVLGNAPGGATGATGFNVPYSVIGRVPGGYMAVDILKQILRRFPGAKAAAGCGFGAGYGVGIGLHYGSGGSRGHSGFGGGGGGSFGGGGGGSFGGGLNYAGSSGGTYEGAAGRYEAAPGLVRPGATGGGAVDRESGSRIAALERKMQELDDRVRLHGKILDLEQRLLKLEHKRR